MHINALLLELILKENFKCGDKAQKDYSFKIIKINILL